MIGGNIMCGIVGFTNYNLKISYKESKSILKNMNDKLYKRGPDEEGTYMKEKIWFSRVVMLLMVMLLY